MYFLFCPVCTTFITLCAVYLRFVFDSSILSSLAPLLTNRRQLPWYGVTLLHITKKSNSKQIDYILISRWLTLWTLYLKLFQLLTTRKPLFRDQRGHYFNQFYAGWTTTPSFTVHFSVSANRDWNHVGFSTTKVKNTRFFRDIQLTRRKKKVFPVYDQLFKVLGKSWVNKKVISRKVVSRSLKKNVRCK